MMNDTVTSLKAFLDASHSVYHAQAQLVKELEQAGYLPLSEAE